MTKNKINTQYIFSEDIKKWQLFIQVGSIHKCNHFDNCMVMTTKAEQKHIL